MKTCKNICPECPFRKQSPRGWLGPHTIDDILDAMQFEQPFTCHMQRTEDSVDEDITDENIDVCRGFLASASASFKLFGGHPVYGTRLKDLQGQITKKEEQQVLSGQEFRTHHTL